MPIWLRNFTFNRIKEYYEEEKKSIEKQSKSLKPKNNKPFKITPNYTTKASNK